MSYKITKQSFLDDVSNHELIVIRNEGNYRHIRLKKPNSGCMHFDIVTWDGHLAYTGDMGCYVFSRVTDMFEFFRDDRENWGVNLGYWAEKLEAVDKTSGYKEFSWDEFEVNVMEFIEDQFDKLTEGDNLKVAREWVAHELSNVEGDEFGAVQFYRDFDEDNEYGVSLQDFWEHSSNVPSNRYVWCCWAIVWAIREYDKYYA
tara:strand:- start:1103 stop:1708 length:606 start_codon:yes stop_codon:yes gene_type:complete